MTLKKLEKWDYRVPQWSSDDLVERSCPICGSHGSPVFQRPDDLIANLCATCGLYFISPAPSETALSRFYAEYHTRHWEFVTPYKSLKELQRWSKTYEKKSSWLVLSKTIDLRNASVLDIGCGTGTFLYTVQRSGGIPFGIDLDADAVNRCNEIAGMKNVVVADALQYLKQHTNQFDLVTMNDLFEHPLPIGDIFQAAMNTLRPNGYLAVWTPNGSAIAKDDDPMALRVDLEHMQYLTGRALNYLVKTNPRYEIVHYEEFGYHAPPASSPPVWRSRLKRLLPGSLLESIRRRKIASNNNAERSGNFHLFTILKRIG